MKWLLGLFPVTWRYVRAAQQHTNTELEIEQTKQYIANDQARLAALQEQEPQRYIDYIDARKAFLTYLRGDKDGNNTPE